MSAGVRRGLGVTTRRLVHVYRSGGVDVAALALPRTGRSTRCEPVRSRCSCRVRSATEVGLLDRADHRLDELSPGELQLLALAVALAPRPGLLLADEPTSQLDHEARDRVVHTLLQVNREHGTTVVLVTHDPDVARALPRTVTIRDGRIGGEGRRGEEFAVVTADGFLPLPGPVVVDLPPGTLVSIHRTGGTYEIRPVEQPGDHRG